MRKLPSTRRAGASALAAAAALLAQQAEAQSASEGEIIVTATKRDEALSDVAGSVSVMTDEDLQRINAQSLSDYIVRVPGVVFNDYQPGVSEVVIRGIAATTYHEQGQTTVGYYINEINVVEPGWPIGIPDVDTFDLDRVEVLRGPQGTLFGSSSLGGAVNYVTKTADPSAIDAAVSGLVGTTKNADGDVNYAAKAMLNLPIIADTLAVRVMGLQRVDAGYLDNPGIGVEGSSDFRTRGLRGSVVFTPSPDTTLTYMSSWQDTKLDDQTYLDIDNPYVRNTARAEPQETSFFLNSLRLEQDLGFGSLTVIGSIIDKDNYTVFSYPYAYVTGVTTGEGAAWSPGVAESNMKSFEARLASSGDGPFKWLVGVSYMHADKSSYDAIYQAGAEDYIDANPGLFGGVSGSLYAPDDRIYGYLTESENEDLGIFGELSFEATEWLELTVGGRYFANSYAASVTNQASYLAGSTTDIVTALDNDEDGFTPKATISITPNDDVLLYATYSRGYRIGGINPNAGLLSDIPATYDSDDVDNYEAGAKLTLAEKTLYLEATIYNLDWNGLQARLFAPPIYYSYVLNAASANVKGAELSATWQPVPLVSLSTNVTYTDAELTSDLPTGYGPIYPAGSTLPGSSEWAVANNVHFSLDDVWGAPQLDISHRYISEAPVAFGNDATRGDFHVFDVTASVSVTPNVEVMLFAKNLFDEYGILNAPFTDALAPAGSIVRPRTLGLRVDWSL